MTPHSSTLAWKIPWTEKPGGLQSTRSIRVGHDWATSLWLFTFMHWRRKWQPTPVFLHGESQGRGSLGESMGSHRVGHDWSDLAAATEAEGYSISENGCRFFLDTGWFFVSLSLFFFFFLREFIAKSRPSAGYIKKKNLNFLLAQNIARSFLTVTVTWSWVQLPPLDGLYLLFLSPLLHSFMLSPYLCKHWSSSPIFCFLWLSTGLGEDHSLTIGWRKVKYQSDGDLENCRVHMSAFIREIQIQRGEVTCLRSCGRLSRPGTVTCRLDSEFLFCFFSIFTTFLF